MRMKNILIFVFLLGQVSLFGQDKYDYTWVMGYPPNDIENNQGGTMIDFNNEPPSISYFENPLFLLSHNVFSDANGDLKFYTNGCAIANANHEIMSNGDSINAGVVYDEYCENFYPLWQGMITLLQPDHDSITSVFHLKRDDD